MTPTFLADPDSRVRELVSIYGARNACVADLLCDSHPLEAVAYTVVGPDLSGETISYAELKADSQRLAAGFASIGIGRGDRVATLMGKSREYLVALMAIWRLGAVHVPLFTAFAPAAIAYRLKESAAKAVICDSAQHPKLVPSEDIPGEVPWQVITTDPAMAPNSISLVDLMAHHEPGLPAAVVGGEAPLIHIYTSGTTGRPKGVIVPVKAISSFHAYAEFGLGLIAQDVYWCAADPGWAYGLYFGIIASFATGVTSLLLKGGFSPDVTLGVLGRYRVTNFTAAPTVYRSLAASGLAVPPGVRLRCASSAGEPLTPDVNRWASEALDLSVHDHFGQTEAGMLINNHHHPLLMRRLRPGSMGHPMPGWSGVVLKRDADEPANIGELGRVAFELCNSPLAWFTEYAGDPGRSAEKFAGNGRWYLTGDIGRVDSNGYFEFSSREDDVIIMAGYRIGPYEIESVLLSHPTVRECAVIAAPDVTRGEVLEAYVVLRPGVKGTPGLVLDLQDWVRKRYAAHAYPRAVHFAEELPKTPSGKVQRSVLRKRRRDEICGGCTQDEPSQRPE